METTKTPTSLLPKRTYVRDGSSSGAATTQDKKKTGIGIPSRIVHPDIQMQGHRQEDSVLIPISNRLQFPTNSGGCSYVVRTQFSVPVVLTQHAKNYAKRLPCHATTTGVIFGSKRLYSWICSDCLVLIFFFLGFVCLSKRRKLLGPSGIVILWRFLVVFQFMKSTI